jgi:hypothetical protein
MAVSCECLSATGSAPAEPEQATDSALAPARHLRGKGSAPAERTRATGSVPVRQPWVPGLAAATRPGARERAPASEDTPRAPADADACGGAGWARGLGVLAQACAPFPVHAAGTRRPRRGLACRVSLRRAGARMQPGLRQCRRRQSPGRRTPRPTARACARISSSPPDWYWRGRQHREVPLARLIGCIDSGESRTTHRTGTAGKCRSLALRRLWWAPDRTKSQRGCGSREPG